MTTHTPPPDDGMATTMDDLDRQANEQQREEAKRNGGNGSHRPMGDGWFWRLTTTKHGNPHPHVANIGIELQYDPAWQGRFYYDELQGQLMLEKPVPDRSGVSRWDGLPRPWQDTDTIAALGLLQSWRLSDHRFRQGRHGDPRIRPPAVSSSSNSRLSRCPDMGRPVADRQLARNILSRRADQ